MKNKERTLARELDSIGQTIFVKNFSLFRKCYANGKNDHKTCKTKLTKIKGGEERHKNGANVCCGAARRIFKQNKVCEALKITETSDSKQIPERVKKHAGWLLKILRAKKISPPPQNTPSTPPCPR